MLYLLLVLTVRYVCSGRRPNHCAHDGEMILGSEFPVSERDMLQSLQSTNVDQAQADNLNSVDLDEGSAMGQSPVSSQPQRTITKRTRPKPATNVFMLEGIDEEESTDAVPNPNGYIDVIDPQDPNNQNSSDEDSDAETDA